MKKLFPFTLMVFLIASMLPANAQTAKRLQQFNTNKTGLAIDGYDPVSYFSAGKAAAGKKEISYTKEGITYRFSTLQNQQLFTADPLKYEPQYGGWCAYAMGSSGEKVEVDPETFKIVNGKLYLFYNSFFNNTLKSWNKNENVLKPKADNNWKHFFDSK